MRKYNSPVVEIKGFDVDSVILDSAAGFNYYADTIEAGINVYGTTSTDDGYVANGFFINWNTEIDQY